MDDANFVNICVCYEFLIFPLSLAEGSLKESREPHMSKINTSRKNAGRTQGGLPYLMSTHHTPDPINPKVSRARSHTAPRDMQIMKQENTQLLFIYMYTRCANHHNH